MLLAIARRRSSSLPPRMARRKIDSEGWFFKHEANVHGCMLCQRKILWETHSHDAAFFKTTHIDAGHGGFLEISSICIGGCFGQFEIDPAACYGGSVTKNRRLGEAEVCVAEINPLGMDVGAYSRTHQQIALFLFSDWADPDLQLGRVALGSARAHAPMPPTTTQLFLTCVAKPEPLSVMIVPSCPCKGSTEVITTCVRVSMYILFLRQHC
jgi:hypothetical protein